MTHEGRRLPPRESAVVLFTLLALFGRAMPATGQDLQNLKVPATLQNPSLETRPAEQARLLADRNAALLSAGPVDPETYILGPGDLVGLEISGPYTISAEDVVGADGSVTFPQLGTFWLGDLTLTQARKLVRERGRSLVRNVEPQLLLKSPRTFKVHVTGAVVTPGSQSATPLTRVSEVIQAAGGLTPGADSRNVQVSHRDSTLSSADLMGFLLDGKLDKNLMLRDGDVVTVRPRTEEITIVGAVLHPGRFDFVPGDELGAMLRLVELHPRADSTRAVLQRFRNDVRWDTLNVELGPVLAGVARVPLRAGDRVLIRSIGEWRTGSTAEVRGAVAFPGPIPVERGTINVAQAIQRAGGLLPDATSERIVLGKPLVPDSTRVSDPLGNETYLSVTAAKPLHERIVDLTKSSGPLVEPGDIITVPRMEPWVEVLGQVVNPGFYPYYPKWTPANYIHAAGGFAHNANKSKTQVSKGRFGDIGYAKDYETLAPGDVIWVPEKNIQGFWNTFRDVITVAGQAAALILVARDITQH
jgi:polysaccharide biosynthesis/export protein